MKRSRFTEEQIIGILREQEAGQKTRRGLPQARDQRRHVLQVEGEVRRSGGVGGQAAEGAEGRERQAEEAAGGGDAGQCGAERHRRKKMVTPAARRSAVAHAREQFGLSERRACSIIGVARRVVRYRLAVPTIAPSGMRLRELAAERRRFGYRRLGILLAREGITDEPQEAACGSTREEGLEGAPARRPQACAGHAGADDAAAGAEPALVAGLRLGHLHRRPALPHLCGRRRLHPGMPGAGARTRRCRVLRVARELDGIIAPAAGR